MGLENWSTLEELQGQIKLRSADPNELYRIIKDNLIYTIDYAEDRVKQIEENWDEELYVDCVSLPGFRSKQIKHTSSDLSDTERTITHHIDKLADYITYAKYDNAEQEAYFDAIFEEKKRHDQLNRSQQKKQANTYVIKDKNKMRPTLLTRLRGSDSNYAIAYIDHIGKYIAKGKIRQLSISHEDAIFYTWKDKELNQQDMFKNSEKYWKYYSNKNQGFSSIFFSPEEPYWKFSYEILENFLSEIERLQEESKVLAVGSKKQINKINSIKLLKTNYREASRELRKPTKLKIGNYQTPDKINYEIAEQTSYIKEDVIEALIISYSNMKEISNNSLGSYWWTMLADLEYMVEYAHLSALQRFIIKHIMTSGHYNLKEIQSEYLHSKQEEISSNKISYNFKSGIKKIVEFNRRRENKC